MQRNYLSSTACRVPCPMLCIERASSYLIGNINYVTVRWQWRRMCTTEWKMVQKFYHGHFESFSQQPKAMWIESQPASTQMRDHSEWNGKKKIREENIVLHFRYSFDLMVFRGSNVIFMECSGFFFWGYSAHSEVNSTLSLPHFLSIQNRKWGGGGGSKNRINDKFILQWFRNWFWIHSELRRNMKKKKKKEQTRSERILLSSRRESKSRETN